MHKLRQSAAFFAGLGIFSLLAAGSVEDEVDYSGLDYSSPAYRVNYKDLADEFDENSIAAESKYDGQLIYVSGPVGSVDKDILDNPYVSITGQYDFASVQCFLTPGEVEGASSLRKGQRVVVAGVVGGTTLGVTLDGCRVVSD
ncbi:hypothetical protein [Synechococcus sp. UW140]|uniref:OB-fold protein n=1 Tax=Synechococcus sp. UW140 TaxID=368503 RepID=UPI000E0F6C99|nr:hypothetical protein [Synechococcus sp. UW140]